MNMKIPKKKKREEREYQNNRQCTGIDMDQFTEHMK